MSSFALDLATVAYALRTLEEHIENCDWQYEDEFQFSFLRWYRDHRHELPTIEYLLDAKTSTDYTVLNAFLQEKGFEPQFDTFDGIGVASVMDLLVEWVTRAKPSDLIGQDMQRYPSFTLDSLFSVTISAVTGFRDYVVKIETKQGVDLYLSMVPRPHDPWELMRLAEKMLIEDSSGVFDYAGVKVPMIDLQVQPDLSWLIGTYTASPTFVITQAFQQFRLRMNDQGARAQVATGVAGIRGIGPRYLVFDKPFMGFFVHQKEPGIPIAAFYADTDCWKDPGSLD